MKIEEIGGEFALIDRLSSIIPVAHTDLIVGMGDDAAVIQTSPEPAPFLLVTTDILVEEQHFKRRWSGPQQIGQKAAECNISDIAAMGGRPTWMFISLSLHKETEVSWVQDLYSGISASCRRHGVVVAGGDTTKGEVNTINITLLGTVSRSHLCLRSHAKAGDRLFVTGPLGASSAAYRLLERGLSPRPGLLEKHLAPKCRLDVSGKIAPLAHAMIDISDGLGSEVFHICRQSHVGAQIHAETIPISEDVIEAGEKLGVDPIEFALGGGEDFELLFSIPVDNMPALSALGFNCHEVGKITKKEDVPLLVTEEGNRPLALGYDHFK